MIHCFKCGADMPDNMIYCLHCGVLLETEPETIVREKVKEIKEDASDPTHSEIVMNWTAETIRKVAFAFIALVLVGLFATLFLSRLAGGENPSIMANNAPANKPVNIPPVNVMLRESPIENSPQQKVKPSPTAINIDEPQGKIIEPEMQQQQQRPPEAVLPPPTNYEPSPPEYNDEEKQLRAICKNGDWSYWQYDRFATCLGRGVRWWNPRWQPPSSKRSQPDRQNYYPPANRPMNYYPPVNSPAWRPANTMKK